MTVGVSIAAGLVLAAGLVAVNPLERWDQLKAPPKLDNPGTRGLTTSHLASTEGTGRYQFWHAGWTAFKSAPAVGIGAAGYESWWAQHGSLDYFVRNAHSLPIEVAAELGVVGLLLLFGFFGSVIYAGVRTRRSSWSSDEAALAAGGLAVLGAGLAAAAVEWTWEIPGVFVPVVVVAGVLAGPALSHGRRLVARRSVPLRVGVALVGVVCVVAGSINLASDSKLRASQEAARDGDVAKAADDARAARKIEPWAAAPRVQEALVQEPGNVRAASQTIDGAIERSDQDWRIWLVATGLRALRLETSRVPARRCTAPGRSPHPRPPSKASCIPPGSVEEPPRPVAELASVPRTADSCRARDFPIRMTPRTRRLLTGTLAVLCLSLPRVRRGQGASSLLRRGGRPGDRADGGGGFPEDASAKLGTLRVDFLWSKVEPTAGAPRDWSFYDQLVGRAARAHVSIMAVLVGSPSFAAESEAYVPATADGRAAFSRFVRDVVKRYGHGGRYWRLHKKLPRKPVATYQIWNRAELPAALVQRAARRRRLRRLPQAAGERDPALRPEGHDRPRRAAGQLPRAERPATGTSPSCTRSRASSGPSTRWR